MESSPFFLSFLILIILFARINVLILLMKDGHKRPFGSWILGETIGLSQDAFLIAVLDLLLNLLAAFNHTWLAIILGPVISALALYPLLDAFLFGSYQLRMRLTYFKYLKDAKSFWHSALQPNVLSRILILFLLIGAILIASFTSLAVVAFNDEEKFFILALILSISGFHAKLRNELSDFYNPWFRDFSLLFFAGLEKGERELYDLRKYLSPAERYEFLTDEYPLLRTTLGFQGTRRFSINIKEKERPHIILVSIESFRAKDIGVLGGAYGASPRFDNLAKEGFLFSNFHASGIPTARSLIGTLFGLYPKLHAEMLFESNPLYPLIGLPGLLKQVGYCTSYIQSGDLYFQNFNSFLESHGYQEIFGDDQILKKIPKAACTSWGVYDEHVFNFAGDYLKANYQMGKPTFLTLLTGTNHHPWKVPENFNVPEFDAPNNSLYRRYLGTHFYSDWALGKFVDFLRKEGIAEKAILLVTADTGQPMGEHFGNYMLFNGLYSEYEHIPLLILADGKIGKPVIIREPASQIDILPTIMDIIGLKGINHGLGTSLLRPIPERTLFIANPHAETTVRAIRGTKTLTLNLSSGKGELFDSAKDPEERQDLAVTHSKEQEALIQEIKTFFSLINALYDQNRICPETKGSVIYPPDPNLKDENLLQDIKNLRDISVISITGCPQLTDLGITQIAKFAESLKILHLSKLLITGKSLETLKKKAFGLKSFKLSYCPKVEPELVERFVPELPLLAEIDFSGCGQLNDASVIALAKGSPHLRTVILKGCVRITDRTLELLASGCPEIRTLDLQGVFNVDDDSMKILGGAVFQLRNLSLLDCPNLSEEEFLIFMREQKEIRELSVSSTSLSDNSLRCLIEENKRLYKICLDDCNSFSESSLISFVEHFSGLEAVGLTHCPNLTDRVLSSLKKLPLQHLFLVDCPHITDAGLQALMDLPLRNLCLLNCPNVSSKKLAELKIYFKNHSTALNILTDLDLDVEEKRILAQ